MVLNVFCISLTCLHWIWATDCVTCRNLNSWITPWFRWFITNSWISLHSLLMRKHLAVAQIRSTITISNIVSNCQHLCSPLSPYQQSSANANHLPRPLPGWTILHPKHHHGCPNDVLDQQALPFCSKTRSGLSYLQMQTLMATHRSQTKRQVLPWLQRKF